MEAKFKETDIGLIPEEWEVKTLSEVTTKITKGTTPTTLKKKFVTEGINFLKAESITELGNFIPEKFMYIDDETHKLLLRSQLEENDILFSIAGVLGRTAFVTKEFLPANINQALAIIRPEFNLIDFKFLKQYLSSKNYFNSVISRLVQTAQPNLSLGVLSNSEIIFPSIEEQRQIAKILNDLDQKINLLQEKNETLEKIAKLQFKKWLVNLEEIPKDWETTSLDKIATYLNGLAMQKFPMTDKDNFLPVIKIRELNGGINEGTDKASADIDEKYIVNDGDILFSWSGTLKVMIWCGGQGALNQHLFKVTSDEYPKWFYYLWTKHHLEEFIHIAKAKATTMGHIQRKHLANAKVLVPSKEDMDKMDKVLNPVIEQIINQKKEIMTLTQLRDTLLPKLMSGKIRVPKEVIENVVHS